MIWLYLKKNMKGNKCIYVCDKWNLIISLACVFYLMVNKRGATASLLSPNNRNKENQTLNLKHPKKYYPRIVCPERNK